MIRKPDFFVVGAAKSGTTSLYRYLVQHPAIFMPKIKEPHFFGEWDLSTGVSSLEEYLDCFPDVTREQAVAVLAILTHRCRPSGKTALPTRRVESW